MASMAGPKAHGSWARVSTFEWFRGTEEDRHLQPAHEQLGGGVVEKSAHIGADERDAAEAQVQEHLE
jgi:hypothetical protein